MTFSRFSGMPAAYLTTPAGKLLFIGYYGTASD